MELAFISGFLISISLILALGPQNVFVLRQGLLRTHVFAACLVCSISDALLIAAGVLGVGLFISEIEELAIWMSVGAALFLIFYGCLRIKSALNPKGMEVGNGMYYNKWMAGNQIAMPAPIYDGSVDYDDGTENTAQQLSEDVTHFLHLAAEPEMEVRKNLGIKVILFFIILGTIVYLAKNRLWRDVT